MARQPAAERRAPVTSTGRPAWIAVFAGPALLCAAWSLVAGKDVSWDLLNYHYYAPYEWLGGRLRQDYFAASGQSYLNPTGYVPFYWLVSAGWHSVVVTMLLAAAHASCISLLYLIAWRMFAHHAERERRVLAILASALGASSAIFWATVGSSFLDPLLAAPMLAGLLVLLGVSPRAPVGRALVAGLLFGSAAALKYSNALFALAAFPLALALPGVRGAVRARAGLAYAAGGVLALAVLAGPWMALMAREFGNPVFPLLNGWFQSPHAPAVNSAGGRFAIPDLLSALIFPFQLIAPDRTLYAEITAPDLRFAALVIAAAALPLKALTERRRGGGHSPLAGTDARVLAFFVLAACVWLVSSANGRYGILVLLLAGLCLARLLERLLPLGPARIAMAALLVAQIAACSMITAPRWFIADRWSWSWLPFAVAEEGVREPALYLTVETLPMAAVAPSLHRDSSFVNLRGQYSIAPGNARLEELFERYRGRVRVMGRFLQLGPDGRPREAVVTAYDSSLIRFGFRIDAGRCFAILWQPDDADALSRFANRFTSQPKEHAAALSMGSCALAAATRDPAHIEEERHVSAVFDRIEKLCPGLLRGHRASTEALGPEWMRNYPGLDARLQTHGDRIVFERYLALSYVDFGALSGWQHGAAALPPACGSDQ
jgi:hypothetical protein